MSDIKQAFGSSAALTITLASLASSAARESVAVDNTSDLYEDTLVTVIVTLAAGGPAGDKAVNVYAYGSEDGSSYTDNATGSDAAITLRSPTNLRLIGVISAPDSGGLVYKSNPMNVAVAFGGVMPRKWGIVVENATGLAFHTSGCSASASGVYHTVA